MQTRMKGKRFAMIEEIKGKSKQELLARFRSVSRIGAKRCHKYFISEGDYFERDKIVIVKLRNTF